MNSAPTIQELTTPPSRDDFTPLQEHQETTPSTFFGGKPVLYSHHSGLTFSAPRDALQSHPNFSKLHTSTDGADEGDVLVKDVEVWVNSDDFILFQRHPSPTGLSIPFPKIALHALMKKSNSPALLMNLSLNDPETVNSADDIDVLEIILLPPGFETENPESECMRDIFQAMNTCAEFHPDAEEEGDAEPDITAPGASGWITAENVGEFMDEEGNFVGTVVGEELGPGAGTVRGREGDEEGGSGVNGVDGHEGKYQRTG